MMGLLSLVKGLHDRVCKLQNIIGTTSTHAPFSVIHTWTILCAPSVKVIDPMSFLYHLVPKQSWDKCKAHREAYYPPTYKQDGFIHLTKDPDFLIGVANNFYLAKEPWEWICLKIDPAALKAPVKFEPAAPVGTTAPPAAWTEDGKAQPQPLFPHLYGTIDFDAVLQEHAVQRDALSGRYLQIDGVTSATASIPVRPCGSDGLRLSAQGLGCMGMSSEFLGYLTKDGSPGGSSEESIAVIHRAHELGITLLDTSDAYGPGKNEVLVGKAIAGRRQDYSIATKFGITFGEGGMGVNGSPEYVRSAVEGSLKRLDVDAIDLYYQHRVDRSVPIEDTWRALKELVTAGKVRHLGISEATAEEIRRAHAIHPISACQLEWSLWSRDVEEELIPTLRDLGIGIVAYSPLGRGMLTGAITSKADLHENDRRNEMPRFKDGALEANLELVARVKELATKKGVTPGQLALAWVHAQGEDVFPIPGTKRMKYLEENAAAFSLKLTQEDKAYLDDLFAPGKVVGGRYSEAAAKHAYDAQ